MARTLIHHMSHGRHLCEGKHSMVSNDCCVESWSGVTCNACWRRKPSMKAVAFPIAKATEQGGR